MGQYSERQHGRADTTLLWAVLELAHQAGLLRIVALRDEHVARWSAVRRHLPPPASVLEQARWSVGLEPFLLSHHQLDQFTC